MPVPIIIRDAEPGDLATVLELMHALADYEGLRPYVTLTHGALADCCLRQPKRRGQWFADITDKKFVVWHGTAGRTMHTPVSGRPGQGNYLDRRLEQQRRSRRRAVARRSRRHDLQDLR